MFINKKARQVIIEIYGAEFRPTLEERLTSNGFTFREESFFNVFWGTRYIIPMPTGRGSQARLTLLEKLCG